MLLLNLTRGSGWRRSRSRGLRARALGTDPDFRVVAPVSLAFDIFKDKQQFRLVGRVHTTLELNCGRCLEPFTLPVDAAFDCATTRTRHTGTGEAEQEIEDDDLTTAFYENDERSRHPIREQFMCRGR